MLRRRPSRGMQILGEHTPRGYHYQILDLKMLLSSQIHIQTLDFHLKLVNFVTIVHR